MTRTKLPPDQPDFINIYKVVMPLYMTWPLTEVALKVFFTEDNAKKFIDEYPNLFVKPLLKVKVETITYTETD